MKKIITFLLSLLTIFTVNGAHYYIDASNYSYSPSSLTIVQGDTVTWTNSQGYHNVNFDVSTISGNSFNNPESFVSAATSSNTIYTHVFNIPGTYTC